MDSPIEKGLEQIENLYMRKSEDGDISEAIKYVEKAYLVFYRKFKDQLTENQKEKLAYIIYTYSLEANKKPKDGFEHNAEFITNLLTQKDRSKENITCFYTKSVLNVMQKFKNSGKYYEVLEWSEKLDPKLMSQEPETFEYINHGMGYFNTDIEKWYAWTANGLIKTHQYAKAEKFIEEAFDKIIFYSDKNKYWFKYRYGLSKQGLFKFEEAINYLLDAYQYLHNWNIETEIAQCYFNLDKYEHALKYALDAALNADGAVHTKVHLYGLLEELLEIKGLRELSYKHRRLIRHINNTENNAVDEPIESEKENYTKKKYNNLENELRKDWAELRYKNKERSIGNIDNITKTEGTIICNGEIYSFKTKTVDNKIKDILLLYDEVSFYKNKYMDKNKEKEIKIAVGIKLSNNSNNKKE